MQIATAVTCESEWKASGKPGSSQMQPWLCKQCASTEPPSHMPMTMQYDCLQLWIEELKSSVYSTLQALRGKGRPGGRGEGAATVKLHPVGSHTCMRPSKTGGLLCGVLKKVWPARPHALASKQYRLARDDTCIPATAVRNVQPDWNRIIPWPCFLLKVRTVLFQCLTEAKLPDTSNLALVVSAHEQSTRMTEAKMVHTGLTALQESHRPPARL